MLHSESDIVLKRKISELEAVLWLSDEPINLRKLTKLCNISDVAQTRDLLTKLQQRYRKRGSAFELSEVAGGIQLLTMPRYAPWLSKYAGHRSGSRLSSPMMETLCIVAYRQPVLRAEIEAIRGVGCGELLRQLLENDLLRITGRSEELGRPLLYGTTKRFLQLFGLRKIEDLSQMGADREPSGPTNNNTTNTSVKKVA